MSKKTKNRGKKHLEGHLRTLSPGAGDAQVRSTPPTMRGRAPTSASTYEADSRQPAPPSARGRLLGAGAGALGGEGLAAHLHPALGEALAAADVIVPLAIALILLTAILYGSSQTCERVFRLLRCITNRPEPPSPATVSPACSPRAER